VRRTPTSSGSISLSRLHGRCQAKKLVEALVIGSNALVEIARTASRNKKSLSTGFYADRFHAEVVKLTRVENLIAPTISGFDSAPLLGHLATVKSTSTAAGERDAAIKQIKLICETQVQPNLSNLGSPTQPTSEPVLSASVLARAPSYLRRTLLQANGCYEKRWFDAWSVMIRKLIENLIIDVYEKANKQAEIQQNGEYLMLSGLITAILNQNHWTRQRETKRSLPDIKKLGDRAAHNRRYETQRQDIDQLLAGLRATVDDLLHLTGHK
jgi:hypothetical protein